MTGTRRLRTDEGVPARLDTAGTDQDGFSHSRERFEQMLAFMGGNHAAALTHAELEDHLDTRGRALLRQLYQDHLDLRALGEARLDGVADAEGCHAGTWKQATSGR